MKTSSIALCFLLLTGCGRTPSVSPEPVSFDLSPSFKKLGNKGTEALDEFQKACPKFAQFSTDFEHLAATEDPRLSFAPNAPHGPDGFHWQTIVKISFKVKNNPDNRELVTNNAFGNYCELSLGAGSNPGIFSKKPACAAICGMAQDVMQGGVTGGFISAPGLAVLDAGH